MKVKHEKYDKVILKKVKRVVPRVRKAIKKGRFKEAVRYLEELREIEPLVSKQSIEEIKEEYDTLQNHIDQLKSFAAEAGIDIKVDDTKLLKAKSRLNDVLSQREQYEQKIEESVSPLTKLRENAKILGFTFSTVTGLGALYYLYKLGDMTSSLISAGISIFGVITVGVITLVTKIKERKMIEGSSPPERLFSKKIKNLLAWEMKYVNDLRSWLLKIADDMFAEAQTLREQADQLEDEAGFIQRLRNYPKYT